MEPPYWLDWEYVPSLHVRDRMLTRGFNETDLRTMLMQASFIGPDTEPGCFRLRAIHGAKHWEIIVRPDIDRNLILVVTAYSII